MDDRDGWRERVRDILAESGTWNDNDINVITDTTQQDSRYRLSGDRDETINHIIVQKEYKTRHDWVAKVIHYELCKKLKFDHTNK